jgi:exosortase
MNDQSTVGILDQFQTDLVATWRRLPNKAFFFALFVAWLVLFQFWGNAVLGVIKTNSLFAWMWEAWRSKEGAAADDSIGKVIPLLVLGLLWWKREELLRQPLKMWLPALLLVIAGLVLHLAGYFLQEPHISIVALFVGIYGLSGLAWGWGWLKNSFFPFCLFVFCVPLGDHSNFITFPLRMLVTRLVEIISHILGINVIRSGTQLGDPSGTFQYDVAAACSGIKSLFSIFLVALVYGFVVFSSWQKRLVMVLLALPFAILGNLLRLLCIVVAAEIGGREAGDFVHENAITSMIPYVPAVVGLFLVANWMEKKEKEAAGSKAQV